MKKTLSFIDAWPTIAQGSDTTASRDSDNVKDCTLEPYPIVDAWFVDPEDDGDSEFLQRYVLFCCNFVESNRKSHAMSQSICWEFVPQTSHPSDCQFQQDFVFIRKLATDCCLTRTSLMMGLNYFLTACRTTITTTSKNSWRMILANCLILAEKMWEDNYIHPHYMRLRFCYHCGSRAVPSSSKFLEFQLELLQLIDWRTNITEQDYCSLHNAVNSTQADPEITQMIKALGEARLPNRPLPPVPRMNNLHR